MYYQLDPQLLGRRDEEFPVERCCQGAACLPAGQAGRHAVLTYIRTDAYVPLLKVGARLAV